MLSHGGNIVDTWRENHVQKHWSWVLVCGLRARLFIIHKKSVFTLCGFPSNCTDNTVPLLWWGLELPTSPKPEMRNDDIKERWKYLKLTIKTQWLGLCQNCHLVSTKVCFFEHYRVTSLCIWSMLSVLSFHVISPQPPWDLCNYLPLHSLWFKNKPPVLYIVNGLDSLKNSCTPMNPKCLSNFIMLRL